MKKWTKEETELLKENYNKLPNDELVKLFPNRTFLSIYKRARKIGLYKTKEIEYLNRSLSKRGEKGSNWKGGRQITTRGYVLIKNPEHHRADKNGYVLEHIYVFEKETGIKVPKNCAIHHLDGNKQNNDISNLCLMSFGGHTTYHNNLRKRTKEKTENE